MKPLIDRLQDRQVCSPPQNWCRNNHLLDEAFQEIARLQDALTQIADAHHMMIEPDLKAIARAALEGKT